MPTIKIYSSKYGLFIKRRIIDFCQKYQEIDAKLTEASF